MSTAVNQTKTQQMMGHAAADKALDSRELLVYPDELLPFYQGELGAKEVSNEVSTKGSNVYSGSVKTSTVIKCLYRDESTNRAFPPDVRKGEEVIIYNYGDDNKWYWKSAARNDNARRTETYRVEISGTTENVGKMDDDNTYFFEMDTRRNHRVRISTSNKDEEQFRYTFQFNADTNEIFLGDDKGNQFYVRSDQPRVCMKNASASLVDLNDKNIVIMAEGDISIVSTKGNLTMSAQQGTSTHYSKQRMYHHTDDVLDTESTKDTNIKVHQNYTRTVDKDSTTTIAGNETISTTGNRTESVEGTETISIKGDRTVSLEATDTLTVKADHTWSVQGRSVGTIQGECTISSQGNMTLGSQAETTIQSASGMKLAAGGGLSMEFNGSGMCNSNGGAMTMKVGKFDITS